MRDDSRIEVLKNIDGVQAYGIPVGAPAPQRLAWKIPRISVIRSFRKPRSYRSPRCRCRRY